MVKIKSIMRVGLRFQNPGGGTSEIISVDANKIVYLRRKSKISLSFNDITDVLDAFKDSTVSTSDLKQFRPNVFDSCARPAGHNCNCTFLFLLLELAGYSSRISGKGVRENPFYIKMNNRDSMDILY